MTTSISSAQSSAFGICLGKFTGALKSAIGTWHAWREQQRAIARLSVMSDRELKDIGVDRDSILQAVSRGRAHADRLPII
jgi:uncharacterized protein YjiS (DUF1127 family)